MARGKRDLEADFRLFWSVYPRRVAKQAALRAWMKLKPDSNTLVKMIAALEQQKKTDQWQKDGGAFIPHPATWLNQGRWEDELTVDIPQQAPDIDHPPPYTGDDSVWLGTSGTENTGWIAAMCAIGCTETEARIIDATEEAQEAEMWATGRYATKGEAAIATTKCRERKCREMVAAREAVDEMDARKLQGLRRMTLADIGGLNEPTGTTAEQGGPCERLG